MSGIRCDDLQGVLGFYLYRVLIKYQKQSDL